MALVRSVWTLLLAVALLVAGYGLFTTVLSLQGVHFGFSDWVIGVVLSASSLGLVISTFYSPKIIRHFGHIRSFAAAAALIAVAI
ncbi:MAG: MFS transporter, partial [Gammaproteobacteria bacterium]|nr:MFS transporter [Gammaproteobacteria bacterium]